MGGSGSELCSGGLFGRPATVAAHSVREQVRDGELEQCGGRGAEGREEEEGEEAEGEGC